MREKRVAVSSYFCCLNESPSEKEGKFPEQLPGVFYGCGLNESPSEKEGKSSSRGKYRVVLLLPQ